MALLALTLQLGLSFGHVHVVHTGQPAVSAAATPTDTADRDSDDYCATCAVLSLLTGAQTTSAPVLPAPALSRVEIAIVLEAVRPASRRAAFNSRAPPLS